MSWACGLRGLLADFARSEGLIDAHAFQSLPRGSHGGSNPDLAAAWANAIRSCPSGIRVLVSHVGFDREDFRKFQVPGQAEGEVAAQRDAERRAWNDPRLRECIACGGVEILRYDEAAQSLLRAWPRRIISA
ncbi:MAG: hypothetical protein WCS65_18105 [Verrucomicrobiae bacterium]